MEFPRLKVVLIESGVTWLPAWMWRANKTWRGVRAEVPWLEQPAGGVSARACAPDHPAVRRAADRGAGRSGCIEEIGSDEMLLFSTDYPHWHFDGQGRAARRLAADLCPQDH